ncbi:unnamed protein product [Coregonus sp. 'balchen']|nr:unnamed protein product [Coregonus sp. 'balchen']
MVSDIPLPALSPGYSNPTASCSAASWRETSHSCVAWPTWGDPRPWSTARMGGAGDAEEKSESTAEDSTEERDSPEESERSLETRSDEEEEEDSSEAGGKSSSTAGNDKTEEGRKERQRTERPLTALLVQCKCCDTEVKASINTGSQHNHISSSCCRRLGLVPTQEGPPCDQTEGQGSVRGLQLQLGRQSVQFSAHVTEDEVFELCLGLQTLQELRCCMDLSSRVLKLQGSGEELPFLEPPLVSQCHHHDSNENLRSEGAAKTEPTPAAFLPSSSSGDINHSVLRLLSGPRPS